MIDSTSVGEPTCFLPFDVLVERSERMPAAPRDAGRVVLLVTRVAGGRRACLDLVRLTADDGMPGDAWKRKTPDKPDAQLAVMQADVATLIAHGQPLPLFGDNLFLDLDLSAANLPIGSRVRAGAAVLEVTPKAHNGCVKFKGRFGGDALRFVAHPERRHRNLRGIYLRVVEDGEVGVGDAVTVLRRTAGGLD
ncbi:MAG: MOSC domain-containing protein [Candidatus Binatia bacterium]